jgi:hypothetical protein
LQPATWWHRPAIGYLACAESANAALQRDVRPRLRSRKTVGLRRNRRTMNSALAVAQITGSHPLRADPVAFASLSKRLLAPLQKAAHLIADLFILQTTCDMGDLRERVGCRPVRALRPTRRLRARHPRATTWSSRRASFAGRWACARGPSYSPFGSGSGRQSRTASLRVRFRLDCRCYGQADSSVGTSARSSCPASVTSSG